MDSTFISFVFWAYVTIGGQCEYQQVGMSVNNHNQVIIVTDRLGVDSTGVHLKTVAPFYKYKFTEDISTDSAMYYSVKCRTLRNGSFLVTLQRKDYYGKKAKRLHRAYFSLKEIYTISTRECVISPPVPDHSKYYKRD